MAKNDKSEQEKMNDAYKQSTGMNVVRDDAPNQGETTFAKDTYKNIPPIQSNPGGSK